MANVFIDIAAEFTGKKAFKQAETSTEKLTKSVKSLAKTFGLAFGTQQVLAYGKAAVKAAAEDQKAQQQLALALKNVGLERDAASSEAYIQSLQSEFGIVDDKLRPAYQTLAVATQDTAEAQRLLNLSLDISASTGKDLQSVTAALSRAYLGNNTSLSKLGVGIAKADLQSKSFEEITAQLTTTFAGSATAAANTFQGSIDKLGVASANVSEIIGTGLIDALTNLGEDTSVAQLATNMEKTALYIADVIRGVGVLTAKLKDLPIIGNFNVGMIPILGTYLEVLREAGKQAPIQKASDNAHLKSLQNQFSITKKTSVIKSKMTAADLAALKAAKLKQAIEKANLALNQGEEVFDMDKIQIAAALTNQAEQLGKATSTAQVLQIANDTARLNVKQSILALEDAIAAKDATAIIAANLKLSEDLKILGALTGQKNQVAAIESILKGLVPKDLIDQKNLDLALLKIKQMLDELAKFKWPTMPNVNLPTGGGGGGGGGGTGGTGGGGTGGTGGTGGGLGGTGTGGLLGGKTAEQLAQDARLKKFYEDELARRAAAKAAAEALASVGKGITEIGILGEKIETIAQGNTIESILEYADAATERANAIADLLDYKTTEDIKILSESVLAEEMFKMLDVASIAQSSLLEGLAGGAGVAGAVSGSRYAAQAANQYNITVQAGVGDPNAIAEAIQNLLREANARGTLTSGILGIA